MKKKHLVIVGVIILSAIVILGLYQTFALSGDITKDTSGYYNVTVTDGTTVTVPAGSTKTVYYKLTNTNKGIVKYGIGYSGTNITVKYYNDTQDPVTGTVDYGKSKFIKLFVQNSGTVSSTATLSTILGYKNGGDLIVPSGVTLVTEKKSPLSSYITNLYNNATKTAVINNSITYQYDTTHSLMKDIGGNIRYYGAKPNNYIYFNCSDYSNQSSSTCETWRIVGVFDGKVKIIRGSRIGSYSWDSSASDVNSGKEVNEWSQADLMKLLNSGYDSESVGGSLYWNAKRGTCFSGQNNATTSCDFTSTGLKNVATRNMIAETTYYTRGHDSNSIFVDAMYDKERVNGTVYDSTRTTTWTGKVAIPYPSDYGYAADLSLCQKQLESYNDTTCTANNWMKNILAPNHGWVLTPSSGNAYYAWNVVSSGRVGNYYNGAFNSYGVAPVLSLNSELSIKAGTGTGSSSTPYQLSV